MMAPRLDAAAPPVKDQAMTLAVAFERYFEAKVRKRSLGEDRRIAEHLLTEFGGGTRLRDLTASRIAAPGGGGEAEVLESTDERRGSSVAEQLIRKQRFVACRGDPNSALMRPMCALSHANHRVERPRILS
jgi:hypothetical protein